MTKRTIIIGISILALCLSSIRALSQQEAQQFYNSRQYGGYVSVAENSESYMVTANGIPDHPMEQVNPNQATERLSVFIAPKNPIIAETPGCLSKGPIGITRTGVRIFNPLNAYGQNAVEGNSAERFDSCDGHADQFGNYHYHKLPQNCLVTGQPDEFIGVAMDGFPIYGPLASDLSREVTNSDLDRCHGRFVNGAYRYHVTNEFPYYLGCFKGRLSTSSPRPMDTVQKVCNETSDLPGNKDSYICTCDTRNQNAMPGMIGRPLIPRGSLVSMEQQQQQQEIMLQMSGQTKLPVNGPSQRLTRIPIVTLGNRPSPGGQIITQQGSQIELPFVRDTAQVGINRPPGANQLPVMQLNSPANEIGQNMNGAPNSQKSEVQNTGRIINGMMVSDQSGTGLGTAVNAVSVQTLNQQQGHQNGRILNGLLVNRRVGTGLGQMPNGLPGQERFIVNGVMVNNRIGTGIGQNGLGGGRLVNPFGPESPFFRNGDKVVDLPLSQDGERSQEDVVFMQSQNRELPIIDGEPSVTQNSFAKELIIQSGSPSVDQAKFGRRMGPLGLTPVGGTQMSINRNDEQNIVPLGFRPVGGRRMAINGNDAQNIVPFGFRPVDGRQMAINGNDEQNIVPLGFRPLDGRQMSINGNDAQNIVPLGFRPVDGRQIAINGNDEQNIVPLGFRPLDGRQMSMNGNDAQNIVPLGFRPLDGRRMSMNGNGAQNTVPLGFRPVDERQMSINVNDEQNIVPMGLKPMQNGGVSSVNGEVPIVQPKQQFGLRGDQNVGARRPQVVGFKPTTGGVMISLDSDASPENKNQTNENQMTGIVIDSQSDSRLRSSVGPRSRSLPLGGFENPVFRRIPYMKSLMESGPYGHYSWLNMYM